MALKLVEPAVQKLTDNSYTMSSAKKSIKVLFAIKFTNSLLTPKEGSN